MTSAAMSEPFDLEDLVRQVRDLSATLRGEAASLSSQSAAIDWRSPAADRMRARVAERDVEARRLAAELDELADRLRAHARAAMERAAEVSRALAAGQGMVEQLAGAGTS